MKFLYSLSFLLLFSVSDTLSQQFNVTSWEYPIGIADFFVDDNGLLVIGDANGIYLYDDSVLIQQISNNDTKPFKGRFGNVLFNEGQYSIVSWTPNGSFTYPGDSSFRPNTFGMIQLSDGRILTGNGSGNKLAIFDSTGVTVLVTKNQVNFGTPLLEINPNLILFGYHGQFLVDTLGYLNVGNDAITTKASSDIIGSNQIFGYDNSLGNKVYMHYSDGVVEVENNSVLQIAYFAQSGISLRLYPAYTTLQNNKYALMDLNYLVLYENGTFTQFDSTNGWKFNIGGLKGVGVSNDGSLYVAQNQRINKFTSPLFTNLKNEITQPELLVYPNPTSGVINLDQHFRINGCVIQLLDLQGRSVFKEDLIDSNQIQLPNSLNDGVYLLKISDANSQKVYRSKLILRRE